MTAASLDPALDPALDQEFVAASRQAVASSPAGSAALDALGWWDLLAALDDPEARAACFALFRAQGAELGDTPALGALAAAPILAAATHAPPGDDGVVLATFLRRSVHRGPVSVLVGAPSADALLVDEPGRGVARVPLEAVTLHEVPVPGRLTLHEVEVDFSRATPVLDDDAARPARARSVALARVAAAYEILGAAEGALDLALEHARSRVQFGQPIGTFQAVRHLLAWAHADCAAIESVATAARDLGVGVSGTVPARVDEVVKALAGRNGRRACERALQVLGGIGFTAELDHHHFHSRVLALDALAGSSAELTAGLGAWMREVRADPGLARAILYDIHA